METHSGVEQCVVVSPARLERATCCSGNSRAFLLRHGDIRPPEAAVAGRACQGRDSNPQWPGGRRLYRTLRYLIARPWHGVTDAARTRSLRDHSPALYLVELQPPCSAKESNQRLAGVGRALSH